jgi:undecaprenyl-diphosphatase
MTPASFLLPRPRLLLGLAILFCSLAVAAAMDHGVALLTWDEPIQRVVENARTPWLDDFFLNVSLLGSTKVVLTLGAAAAVVAWWRCRALAAAIALATVSRPLLEFTLKILVGRDRPDLERMVHGEGPSFPSGHVMAAVALWGLLPLLVALVTRRRWVWWTSVIVSGSLIVLIAASRTYLGVHWFSDITGGLVLGSFFLLGVETALKHGHRWRPCPSVADEATLPVSDPAPV